MNFEPTTGPRDPFDPGRGRTFYPDDTRSERILALIGQDALYIVTDRSVRCLFGDGPDNWRLVKLGESDGSVHAKAAYGYKGGVLVLCNSGRLLYYHVSLPEPEEVGHKLRRRIGSDSLAGMDRVAVRPDGEIEVCGDATYWLMDLMGRWRSGVRADSFYAPLYVPGLALRWVGDDGALYEGDEDQYVSDGGTAGDTGDPAYWRIKGKVHLLPRSLVVNAFIGDSVQVVNPQDTRYAVWPRITIFDEDGSQTYYPRYRDRNVKIGRKSTGAALQVMIEGDKDTVVTEFRLEIEGIAKAKNPNNKVPSG